MKEREAICDVCHKMWQLGWVASNDGNVSLKLPDGTFLATPTGISKSFVTPEKIEADMKAMPQRKAGQEQDKYYLGYFDVHQRLVAVMDFIDHYPDAQSGFIGFFMMEKDLQGTGVGSSIITNLCACLAQWDYQYIRLGYVDGNEQSRSFWLKNQFTDTGLRDHTNNYTVVVMNRFLTKV